MQCITAAGYKLPPCINPNYKITPTNEMHGTEVNVHAKSERMATDLMED
jgi:hypothetical protein